MSSNFVVILAKLAAWGKFRTIRIHLSIYTRWALVSSPSPPIRCSNNGPPVIVSKTLLGGGMLLFPFYGGVDSFA